MKKSCFKLLVISTMFIFAFFGTAGHNVIAQEDVFVKSDLMLKINGEQVEAEMFIEEGRVQIEAEAVNELFNGDFEEKFISLREVFETARAKVDWNGQERIINITLAEIDSEGMSNIELNSDEIVILAEEYILEKNTYKMSGNGISSFEMELPDMPVFPVLEFPINIEADLQYDPFKLYIKQSMDIPQEMLIELDNEGSSFDTVTNTEMLILEDKFYQNYPEDQWIVMSFEDLGMDEMLQYLTNMDPRETIELGKQYGIEYDLIDELTFNGEDCYVIRVELETDTLVSFIKDIFGESQLTLIDEGDLTKEELEIMNEQMLNLLDSIEMAIVQDMVINKETYETHQIISEMDYTFEINEVIEGEDFSGKVKTSSFMTLELFDYGVELDFPEIADAITLEEFTEVLLNE